MEDNAEKVIITGWQKSLRFITPHSSVEALGSMLTYRATKAENLRKVAL